LYLYRSVTQDFAPLNLILPNFRIDVTTVNKNFLMPYNAQKKDAIGARGLSSSNGDADTLAETLFQLLT